MTAVSAPLDLERICGAPMTQRSERETAATERTNSDILGLAICSSLRMYASSETVAVVRRFSLKDNGRCFSPSTSIYPHNPPIIPPGNPLWKTRSMHLAR